MGQLGRLGQLSGQNLPGHKIYHLSLVTAAFNLESGQAQAL